MISFLKQIAQPFTIDHLNQRVAVNRKAGRLVAAWLPAASATDALFTFRDPEED